MQMSQKGAFKRMRLTRPRAEALLESLSQVIYYFPACHCDGGEDDCHCDDNYFAGIYWLKNEIFRVYPDLSDYKNPTPELFTEEKLLKIEAIYLREALNIASNLFGAEPVANAAHDWAFNLIYKRYSIFDLAG